jgi:CheY-like chemotaxis protein
MSESPILLVEDNEDDVFIFKRALRKVSQQYAVQHVPDGQKAIEYLMGAGTHSENFRLPFLVFLDLKLPFRDGFEVLEWMRAKPELRDLKVVVLSSSPEQRDIQLARALGACSYLIKPPNPEAIARVLTDVQQGL